MYVQVKPLELNIEACTACWLVISAQSFGFETFWRLCHFFLRRLAQPGFIPIWRTVPFLNAAERKVTAKPNRRTFGINILAVAINNVEDP